MVAIRAATMLSLAPLTVMVRPVICSLWLKAILLLLVRIGNLKLKTEIRHFTLANSQSRVPCRTPSHCSASGLLGVCRLPCL